MCCTAARRLEPEFFSALPLYDCGGGRGAGEIAQRARLVDCMDKVDWVDSMDALMPFVGVHFSNELVDAFPGACGPLERRRMV